MNEDEAELAAWSAEVAPDEWVRDQGWSHPDPEFAEALATAAHARVTRPAPRRNA